eukprot:scaffold63653_cov25-Tisochrysis_lutea.AAC.5
MLRPQSPRSSSRAAGRRGPRPRGVGLLPQTLWLRCSLETSACCGEPAKAAWIPMAGALCTVFVPLQHCAFPFRQKPAQGRRWEQSVLMAACRQRLLSDML